MKGKYLVLLVIPMFLFAFLLTVSASEASAQAAEDHKIDLCHAKPPATAKNGFKLLNIDKNAVFKKGHDIHAMDIIPMFTYEKKEVTGTEFVCPKNYSESTVTCPGRCQKDGDPTNAKKCKDMKEVKVYGMVEYTFPGLNWGEGGQIVLNNKCVVPKECEYQTEPESTLWSEWLGVLGTLDIYRTKVTKTYDLVQRDLFKNDVLCSEVEERYDACDSTVIEEGVWSAWKVDPLDDTQEYREKTTLTLDSTDETVICDTKLDTEYQDIPIEEEEEPEEEEDDGDVLGEDDEKEEVTAEVLGAETGGGDSLVIVAESLLILASLYSIVHTAKKYIIG